jgi:hypothetical protein
MAWALEQTLTLCSGEEGTGYVPLDRRCGAIVGTGSELQPIMVRSRQGLHDAVSTAGGRPAPCNLRFLG